MLIHRADTPDEHVLVVAGDVGPAQTHELRSHLLHALAAGASDLMFDARQVTRFEDVALSALTATRSRAKFQRNRFVVLDHHAGPVNTSLRRSGLNFRIDVFPDVTVAHQSIADHRAAPRRLSLRRQPGSATAPVPAVDAPARPPAPDPRLASREPSIAHTRPNAIGAGSPADQPMTRWESEGGHLGR
jgi:anti-anti-sigma regulatory factor